MEAETASDSDSSSENTDSVASSGRCFFFFFFFSMSSRVTRPVSTRKSRMSPASVETGKDLPQRRQRAPRAGPWPLVGGVVDQQVFGRVRFVATDFLVRLGRTKSESGVSGEWGAAHAELCHCDRRSAVQFSLRGPERHIVRIRRCVPPVPEPQL